MKSQISGNAPISGNSITDRVTLAEATPQAEQQPNMNGGNLARSQIGGEGEEAQDTSRSGGQTG